jgi:two-component system chemotaxis sensor kinase CheA
MDRDRLVQRLMASFMAEFEEHLAALNRDLLALEKAPGGEERAVLLHTLFRTVHTLKSAARSVDLTLVETGAHSLEELLAAARDGKQVLDAGVFALLYEAVDALEEVRRRLVDGQSLDGAPLAGMLARIEAVARGAAPSLRASAGARNGGPHGPVVPGPRPGSPTAPTVVGAPTGPPATAPSTPPPPAPAPPVAAALRPVTAAPESASAPEGAAQAVVRVAVHKLDPLEAHVGEARVAARRVAAEYEVLLEALGGAPLASRTEAALGQLEATLRALERTVGDAAEEVRVLRLLPFSEACPGLPRLVRDFERQAGKQVELRLDGGEVELDRAVLEGLKDPLMHLVRNAVDHGVEAPEERVRVGKQPRGVVSVSAVARGALVQVSVADDGRGLDLEALRVALGRRRLPVPEDERELARCVFLPGVSTAARVTDVSGRGVGLDVVKTRVEAMHGGVDVETSPGRGVRFVLHVPLTLTRTRGLVVYAGGWPYVLPASAVKAVAQVGRDQFRVLDGRDVLPRDGQAVPAAALSATLGLRPQVQPPSGVVPVAVVADAGGSTAALTLEGLGGEGDFTIKALGRRLGRNAYVQGATFLPDGQVSLVLNPHTLVREVTHGRARLAEGGAGGQPGEPDARRHVLLVEDSLTTRALETMILEAAGYRVTAAGDGQEALELLKRLRVDAVVTDVQMPRLDGIGLTRAIRGAREHAELPVILVTGLESEVDRQQGLDAGADAYLAKSAFDQKALLELLAQLV